MCICQEAFDNTSYGNSDYPWEASDAAILEFTGDKEEIEEILTRMEALGMEDFARTGVIALEREMCSRKR